MSNAEDQRAKLAANMPSLRLQVVLSIINGAVSASGGLNYDCWEENRVIEQAFDLAERVLEIEAERAKNDTI